MASRNLYQNSTDIVLDYLKGLALITPGIELDAEAKIIYRDVIEANKVGVISGGGAGHEPAHAAYVGAGLLTAAVCGNIFASPNAMQIKAALTRVSSKAGMLIVVKSYTGDVLQFGIAQEHFQALHPDLKKKTRFLVVGDDISVGRKQGRLVGRRGIAGVPLVYKVAGSLARNGADIDEVERVAKIVANGLATLGCSLDRCHIPGGGSSADHENLEIRPSHLELGSGIHNEPGFQTMPLGPDPKALIKRMVELLLNTEDEDRSFVPFRNDGSDEVVVLVNNLGGLSELELIAIIPAIKDALADKEVIVRCVISGSYLTSLNTVGFSITLLHLPTDIKDKQTITNSLLDDTDAPGWNNKISRDLSRERSTMSTSAGNKNDLKHSMPKSDQGFTLAASTDGKTFTSIIEKACIALIQAEPEITRYDLIAGDGDCGFTLKAGADIILAATKRGEISNHDVRGSIMAIAEICERDMGGTSGALYSLASVLEEASQKGATTATSSLWIEAMNHALSVLFRYTKARRPSRTLVDPLQAFAESLKDNPSLPEVALQSAKEAVEQTKKMIATAGRAAYIDQEALADKAVPDPGAWGVLCILNSLVQHRES